MIYLGDSREVKLERSDVETIEQRLEEMKYIILEEFEEDDNRLTDIKNKINTVEFTIQSNRV